MDRKIKLIIAAVIVLVLFLIYSALTACPGCGVIRPQPARQAALDKACDTWRSDNCDPDNYDTPTTHHQEPGEEGSRLYSVKELCEIMQLSDNACYTWCGCSI